jgi:SAM-dependent methyltransferase
MCTRSCIDFVARALDTTEVRGKAVLEVGALDFNGSVRPAVEALGPASYIGVDLESGPGVDEVCDASALVERFKADAFDVVISTEMVEHVPDWRLAIRNLKAVTRPGGLLLVTTRSHGFPYHGYPYDYWRFEQDDMADIFSDFDDTITESDGEAPGVFVKARKPSSPRSTDLDSVWLYSILTGLRQPSIRAVMATVAAGGVQEDRTGQVSAVGA